MTNDQTGGTPRQTTGGSPAASTIMIVVTVVAVVIGFFILKKIRDDGDGAGSTRSPATTIVVSSSTSTPDAGTTISPTTTPVEVKTGTKVQVANASSTSGVAGKLTTDLKSAGFDMGKATNSSAPNIDASVVYYDAANPAAQPVAETVARAMGTGPAQALPSPIPVTGAKLDTGAGVLVLLGNDKAGKTLAQMGGASAPATAAAGAATTTTARAKATTTTKKTG